MYGMTIELLSEFMDGTIHRIVQALYLEMCSFTPLPHI